MTKVEINSNHKIELEQETEKLTKDQIRKHKGLENLSDKEASEVAETLFNLSIICYLICQDENTQGIRKIRA